MYVLWMERRFGHANEIVGVTANGVAHFVEWHHYGSSLGDPRELTYRRKFESIDQAKKALANTQFYERLLAPKSWPYFEMPS